MSDTELTSARLCLCNNIIGIYLCLQIASLPPSDILESVAPALSDLKLENKKYTLKTAVTREAELSKFMHRPMVSWCVHSTLQRIYMRSSQHFLVFIKSINSYTDKRSIMC